MAANTDTSCIERTGVPGGEAGWLVSLRRGGRPMSMAVLDATLGGEAQVFVVDRTI